MFRFKIGNIVFSVTIPNNCLQICLKRPRLKIGAVPKLLLKKNQCNLGSIEVICDTDTKLLGNKVLMNLLILFS